MQGVKLCSSMILDW